MISERRTPNAILECAMTAAALRPRHRETRMTISTTAISDETRQLALTRIVLGYAPYAQLAAFAEGFVDYELGRHRNPYAGLTDVDGAVAAQAWDRGHEARMRYGRALRDIQDHVAGRSESAEPVQPLDHVPMFPPVEPARRGVVGRVRDLIRAM
ncbi:hypothetical protein RHODGE_RHODGE_03292 [Rhodoplanes serenus]|uniref:Uncharacterized protein n=1 Tax=Rhodoplanes serenus TaxID=200615 RepID=A0A3S4B629_9BRAD|nr:hypothetical protein [Rhodoplanes serenus]VCU10106.1 hypothetical protein RHODGE_RHODGE_03292 [Rhodoplanes serenus]